MNEATWLTSTDPAVMLAACMSHTIPGAVGFVVPGKLGTIAYRPSDRKLRLFACACCRAVWGLLTDHRSRRAVEVAERYADGEATEKELREADNAATDASYAVNAASEVAMWVCDTRPAADGSPWYLQLSRQAITAGVKPTTQAALLRDIVGNPWRSGYVPRGKWVWGKPGEDAAPWLPDEWLTPTVLALARAAYEERERKCKQCQGTGQQGARIFPASPRCPDCHGSGVIEDGTLEPDRLAVLADALEEAGCPVDESCRRCGHKPRGVLHPDGGWVTCPECGGAPYRVPNPLLAHLRDSGPHVRGCWALDLLLGRA